MEYNFALRAENISKTYGTHKVLDNVTLAVKKGEIYGFVGENGAGKTTLIRVVSGLSRPDSGNYYLFDVAASSPEILNARKNVGAIVEAPSIMPHYNARKNLEYQASLMGKKMTQEEIDDILNFVGLGNVEANKKTGNYSLGMRQRLGIAVCLVGHPQFLILDEPINGLDPVGIVELRNLILRLKNEKGISFLISSHILSELSLIADKFGFISHGKLIKEATKEEIEKECRSETVIKTTDNAKAYTLIKDVVGEENLDFYDDSISILTSDIDVSQIVTKLSLDGISVVGIHTKEGTLEDYYMKIIGGPKNE